MSVAKAFGPVANRRALSDDASVIIWNVFFAHSLENGFKNCCDFYQHLRYIYLTPWGGMAYTMHVGMCTRRAASTFFIYLPVIFSISPAHQWRAPLVW